MKRRTAVVSAGIAAGVAAGVIGGAIVRRRRPADVEPIGAVPPEDLGRLASFDGTEIAVRAAGAPSAPVLLLAHGSLLCQAARSRAADAVVSASDIRARNTTSERCRLRARSASVLVLPNVILRSR